MNVTGDNTRETFPRGPSNEQTLLTELGEAKEQIHRLRESLAWALDHLHLFADANPGYAPAVAILKETAPTLNDH